MTVTCPVCRSETPQGAAFCSRCTNPIGVVSLSELSASDQTVALRALFQSLATSASSEPAAEPDDLFHAYLSAYWLRPETALILYAEASTIATLKPDMPPGPWLDLGCGDGTHAALYSGWRFDPSFDCFQSVNLAARDIYDHFEPAEFAAPVLHRGRVIDLGVDIKPSAIARASHLGVFADVQLADAARLPVADGNMAVIFSNMLRDLGDSLPDALAEVHRILRPDGRLIFSAMTPAYADSLHFAPAAKQAADAGQTLLAQQFSRLDRGRSTFCRQQLSSAQWHRLLSAAGFTLEATIPLVGAEAIRFWDIGLRPFSIPLIRQAATWRAAGVLPHIKPGAVELLSTLLAGLRSNLNAGHTCMHMVVAKPA